MRIPSAKDTRQKRLELARRLRRPVTDLSDRAVQVATKANASTTWKRPVVRFDRETADYHHELVRRRKSPSRLADGDSKGPAVNDDWLNFRLQDEDGDPVEGERFEIELSDGSTASGATDSNGHVELTSLPPGALRISFPDLDGSEWSLT